MGSKIPLWAHITLGIVIGFSVLGFGWIVTVGYIAEKEVEAFTRQVEGIARKAKAEQALQEARRNVQLEAEARAREQVRLKALAAQRRSAEKSRLAWQRAQDFESWYEANRSEACREASNGDLDVECVNEKMRAKRNFMVSD